MMTTAHMAIKIEKAYTIYSNGSSEKKAIKNIITVAKARIRMQKSLVCFNMHI
jgi:hypothetical protein